MGEPYCVLRAGWFNRSKHTNVDSERIVCETRYCVRQVEYER